MHIQKILVPTGFDEQSINALEVAIEMAKVNNSTIDFLHIVEIPMAARLNEMGEYESEKDTGKTFLNQIKSAALKRLGKILTDFKVGVKINPVIKLEHDPKNIVNIISKDHYDLVVLGGDVHHRRHKLIFDTSHEKFIENVRCPVISVNQKVKNFSPRKILIPTNFNRNIEKVRGDIDNFIKKFKAQTAFVYINTPINFKKTPETRQLYRDYLQENNFENSQFIVYNYDHVERGILSFAYEERFDLIIMLSDQEGKLQRFLRGDLVDGVVNHSTIPVLTFTLKSRI